MNYKELNDSLIEIVNNDKISKKGLSLTYKLNAEDFNSVYQNFLQDHGGEEKTDLNFFDIELDYGVIIRCMLND